MSERTDNNKQLEELRFELAKMTHTANAFRHVIVKVQQGVSLDDIIERNQEMLCDMEQFINHWLAIFEKERTTIH